MLLIHAYTIIISTIINYFLARIPSFLTVTCKLLAPATIAFIPISLLFPPAISLILGSL